MADQDPKTELSKEVLAPPEDIREDLVATAVKFLQNPKVTQSPISQKKAFLQRKGLTLEEIELAIQRSGISQTTTQTTSGDNVAASPGYNGLPPPGIPSKQPDLVVSRWTKARDVLTVLAMVTGISYAAYRLYKEFLRPWLFGEPTVSKRLDQLEKMMSESVGGVNATLASVEQTLKTQQEKLQVLSHDVNSKTGGFESVTSLQNTNGLSDIKSELSSIKGLLLNRRQFPPMPSSSPVLPAWQLASSSGDANANSNNKGKQEEEGPAATAQVTMTTSPLPDSTETESRSETGSPVTVDTKADDIEAEKTVSAESEESSTAEVKASENQVADFETENDLENEVREPEVKVIEPEVKVTGEGDAAASMASTD